MRIITWKAEADDTPARWLWIARIVTPMKGPKGKDVDDFLPVFFQGPTDQYVRAQAQKHWDHWIEKVERENGLKAEKAAAKAGKKARADDTPPEVI